MEESVKKCRCIKEHSPFVTKGFHFFDKGKEYFYEDMGNYFRVYPGQRLDDYEVLSPEEFKKHFHA